MKIAPKSIAEDVGGQLKALDAGIQDKTTARDKLIEEGWTLFGKCQEEFSTLDTLTNSRAEELLTELGLQDLPLLEAQPISRKNTEKIVQPSVDNGTLSKLSGGFRNLINTANGFLNPKNTPTNRIRTCLGELNRNLQACAENHTHILLASTALQLTVQSANGIRYGTVTTLARMFDDGRNSTGSMDAAVNVGFADRTAHTYSVPPLPVIGLPPTLPQGFDGQLLTDELIQKYVPAS